MAERMVKHMTIKEMEEITGMSRTNIRFYEGEGLIHPKRRENGYREYSDDDAQTLMKVKLLRSMEVPLEQVKAAAFGEMQLREILASLDDALERQQKHQERTRLALRQMQQSGAEFSDLKPEEYLPILENGEAVEDAPPRLNLPWRRYFARGFDLSLYNTVVGILLYDFLNREIYLTILTLIAMLILEPLFLSLFGTTPGKAIFGIRVTDPEGSRLDYSTAMDRTWTVMWEGMAMSIPVVCLYFQYKSLDAVEQDIPLSWENASELTFKDDKMWRFIPFVLGHVALIAISVASVFILGGFHL